MTKTIIGIYENLEQAHEVVNDLVNAGFNRNTISVVAQDPDERYSSYLDRGTDGGGEDVAQGAGIGAAIGGLGGLLIGLGALAIPGIGPVVAAGPIAAALAGAGIGAVTGGIIGALVDLGIPEEEAQIYAESVRRGNVLVAAQVDDQRANEASRIMERQGLIDIERQADDWRSSGWTGFRTDGETRASQRGRTDGQTRRTTDGEDETIEVVEEEVKIGKRAVQEGGVRIRSYVRQVPVEEEVRLRQEQVHVERRPVDRPATAEDLRNFREGTVEVTEMHEEPVVSKEARVVEEVSVHKDVEEHTERVRDTARRTEVEVEQMGQRTQSGNGFATYDIYDPDFRTHFQTTYAQTGNRFEQYQPAYRYGYTLAVDDRYQGRSWRDIEPEVRNAWESRNQGTWDNFKDSIEYAWQKVRGRA